MPVSAAHAYIALIEFLCEHGSAFMYWFHFPRARNGSSELYRQMIQPLKQAVAADARFCRSDVVYIYRGLYCC
jgi:hypothetical protein